MSRFGMVESGSEYCLADKTENGPRSKDILFVCSTNMFISPIAEAIFNENSQEKAVSAGLYGSFSSEMPFATIRTCQNHGLDVSDKRITHILDISMEDIGLVLAATCEIRDALKIQYPDLEIFTIRQYSGESHGLDIEDPMGGPFEGYGNCFNEIEEAVLRIIGCRKEIAEKPVRIESFRYLDDLIHSGENEIVLDSDIILGNGEEREYAYGIDLDLRELVIDGNGHTVDARSKAQIFGCKGKTTIKNITLKNGLSKSDGGAIINWRGELTIVEATFIGNYAEDNGGAIANYGDALNIINSTFIKNSSQYQQSGEGGAIYNGRGDLNIAESDFIKNTANTGGSIYNTDGKLTVEKCMFKENAVGSEGGAIFNLYSKPCVISKSEFNGNNAAFRGGAIHHHNGEFKVMDSTFASNVSQSGAAISNVKGIFKIFNCNVGVNEASNDIIFNSDSLQIYNADFKYNISNNMISNIGDESNMGISNGKIEKNHFRESLIHNDGKFCSIEKTVFTNNWNLSSLDSSNKILNKSELLLIGPKIESAGREIWNEGSIILKNLSPDFKRGIYGGGTIESVDGLSADEKFDFRYLDKMIHQENADKIVLDQDILFENYEMDFYEGGIELDRDGLVIDGNGKTIDAGNRTRIFIVTGKNITLKNITFKNGHSHRNYDSPRNDNGGAIRVNRNADLRIENCRFTDNSSEGHGGAIANRGNLSVTESLLSNNTSMKKGGAICNNRAELSIDRSCFKHNDEGAIFNCRGIINVRKSILNENASQWGGAILNWQGNLTVTGSTLNQNDASQRGGAICNNNGRLTVRDSIMNQNTSKYEGGAINNIHEKAFDMENCKFKDNEPDNCY